MFATIRGTKIYFDIEGSALVPNGDRMEEKPVAFLLHGGPGVDHTSYKPTFSRLGDHMQLVYIDHRGQGRSERGDPSTYTLDHNVEDIEALRQYLGLGKIIVIGGSYGGMVALTYASRYPQNLSHLVAIATAPDFRFLERAQEILAQRGTVEQIAIAQHLWDGNFESEAQLRQYFQVMQPLYSITYTPNNKPTAWDRAILSVEAINVAFGGFLRTYDVLKDLPRITAPTLVIGGRHDWICPPECSEAIAAAIPNAELQIFEGSGHSIRTDEPDALLDAIAHFVTTSTD
ncbi:alpha/beta fold hydrolase [Myxacorys almedinensis]|uniref:Alpha/beta fold hydrolase n=1 Tax=Myxacorys almedinensis A TaxID=2690445 RepID=A0A8J7Z309_9CYAN|nr:alpha/beta hydrolase [Myxacorys almedinensis]NDJ19072.1 alpha/beta fold hydrolase [Myxacorys almedinensis A]